jgi:hypothetical protein
VFSEGLNEIGPKMKSWVIVWQREKEIADGSNRPSRDF